MSAPTVDHAAALERIRVATESAVAKRDEHAAAPTRATAEALEAAALELFHAAHAHRVTL